MEQFFHLPEGQVATTLLVSGPTLTLWIPGHTLFASTSLYSSLIQRMQLAACTCSIITSSYVYPKLRNLTLIGLMGFPSKRSMILIGSK